MLFLQELTNELDFASVDVVHCACVVLINDIQHDQVRLQLSN